MQLGIKIDKVHKILTFDEKDFKKIHRFKY